LKIALDFKVDLFLDSQPSY